MRRYLDNAILFDFLGLAFICIVLVFIKPVFNTFINVSTILDLNAFIVSLITVSSTLIGFFLTIITVIITFKKGFEDKAKNQNTAGEKKVIPNQSIFERMISKESKFYGTNIYKNVLNIFLSATFEISIVLISLFVLQFSARNFSLFCILFVSGGAFLLLIVSLLRSLYIFKLFLNVHT